MNDVTAKVFAKAGHVIFEGLVTDAEKFIEDNFPRIHSDIAGPDYTVVTDPPGHPVAVPATSPQPVTDEAEATPEPDEPAETEPVT